MCGKNRWENLNKEIPSCPTNLIIRRTLWTPEGENEEATHFQRHHGKDLCLRTTCVFLVFIFVIKLCHSRIFYILLLRGRNATFKSSLSKVQRTEHKPVQELYDFLNLHISQSKSVPYFLYNTNYINMYHCHSWNGSEKVQLLKP